MSGLRWRRQDETEAISLERSQSPTCMGEQIMNVAA